MSAATTMHKLGRAIDWMQDAASEVALDNWRNRAKHNPATLHNLLEFNDATNYACILLRAAREAVASNPSERAALALAKLERRFTNLVLTLCDDFLGDSHDGHTVH